MCYNFHLGGADSDTEEVRFLAIEEGRERHADDLILARAIHG